MSFKSGISLKTGGRRMAKRVSKNDFEKVDLRIKKITEQTVEQIEVDSE